MRVTPVISHLVLVVIILLGTDAHAERVAVATSPNGRIGLEFLFLPGSPQPVPGYRITWGETEVIGPSRLGIELDGESGLGTSTQVEGTDTRTIDERFEQIIGKQRHIVSRATETVVRLRETAEPRRRWEVVLHAADDGVAVRYRFPAIQANDSLAIRQELTEFRLPETARTTALPVQNYTTSFEAFYKSQLVRELTENALFTLPLLAECQSGVFAAVTEANVNEYAGAYLTPQKGGGLQTRLSPLPKEPGISVRAKLPHASPWRVVLLGDRIGQLIESNLLLSLNEPCAIKDTSWIHSGKTTFPWWNGYFEKDVPFKPGLNTATVNHYIDFCAEAGIPYHSLDGLGDEAWYGGPINPWKGDDPTTAIEGLDIPAVLSHAKEKGVRLRLWMNWKAAEAHMERSFPLYHEWGIEGVMLDFMDRDDQEMNRFLRRAIQLAAENQLTVTLHGVSKPTGLERTYPNLLTSEGVLNLEYNKWNKVGLPAEHEVTVAMTRMLAGPLDFHQGSFRTVRPGEFQSQYAAPLVIGSPARTLASYVVYQNHLSMVADYPSAYRGHPALPILAEIPTTWDETRVLDAKLGEFIVIARRSAKTWYVGAMTDGQARILSLPLAFLSTGPHRAEMFVDDDSVSTRFAIREESVTSATPLKLSLSPAGGGLVRLTQAP